MKFKDAYCTKLKKLLFVDEITFYYRFDKQFYKDNIEKYMICPECKLPRLSYNNAATPYLSVYPNEKHTDECSLKQDEMNSVQTKTFIDDPKNREQISRQIESVLTTMLDTVPSAAAKTKSIKLGTSSEIPYSPKLQKTPKKRIPRKRIDLKFTPDDFECYKLFYGSVRINWEKDKDTEDYKILLRRQDKSDNRLLCRLKISDKVYSYLPYEFKTPREFNCNIVFLAKFTDKGRSYQDTWIKTSQYISLTKTKP